MSEGNRNPEWFDSDDDEQPPRTCGVCYEDFDPHHFKAYGRKHDFRDANAEDLCGGSR